MGVSDVDNSRQRVRGFRIVDIYTIYLQSTLWFFGFFGYSESIIKSANFDLGNDNYFAAGSSREFHSL